MEALAAEPWVSVSLGGRSLLAKSCFGETCYRILLSDLRCVWEESMEADALHSRAQALNQRLSASVTSFSSRLRSLAKPVLSGVAPPGPAPCQMSVLEQPEDKVTLVLRSQLDGLPFHWEFRCSPAPISLVCVELVRPLLTVSLLLQQQLQQLKELLVRKDAQILDYSDNGATLSRERLRTDVFDERSHSEEFMSKVLPGLCDEPWDAQRFHGVLQPLHAVLTAQRKSRKRQHEDDAPSLETSSAPSLETSSAPSLERSSAPSSSAADTEADRKHGHAHKATTQQQGHAHKTTTTQQQPQPAQRQSSKAKKKKVGLFS